MDKIKRVSLGLSKSLVNEVLWVARKYRTNSLSHEPGGSDVVVEYHSNDVLGYDWIKFPSKYVSRIWNKGISEIHDDYENWEEDEQIELIKKKINRIYARRYKKGNIEFVPFKEIWNSKTSDEIPWKILEDFDMNVVKFKMFTS